MKKIALIILAFSLLISFISACNTILSSNNSVNRKRPVGSDKNFVWNNPKLGLKKQMTESEVKEVLGTPTEIRPMESLPADQGHAEIWTYKRTSTTNVNQVATKMVDKPYWNPLSGTTETISEPTYELQYEKSDELLELLFLNGLLLEWKHYQNRKLSF